jgi:superfamily II DNA or RNA helicase
MIKSFSDIDNLSKSDFEIFVAQIFSNCGWDNVEITKPGVEYKYGDGGVDIFCEKLSERFAIECKHRKINNKCDVKDLYQLHTGADLAKVKNKILVTNTYFTSETEFRAFLLGIELVDRNKLKDFYESKTTEIGKKIIPYPYQKEIVDQCVKNFNANKNKILIELATGLGKTYTAAFVVREFLNKENNLKVLFLAHQVEIITQSVTAFKNVFGIGTYNYSGCVGGFIPEERTTFTFAVFDTLYSNINKFKKNEFDIIIVDEAHHVPANTYKTVVEYFQPKLLIGLTATPFRTDKQDVHKYFGGLDGHVGKYDLYWALKHKWLAFPKYQVYGHDISQEKIDAIQKGFSVQDIDKNLFVKEKDEKMIETLEKKANEIKNCKAIVFCRNITHIKNLIKHFPSGSATYAYSKMSGEERRENIRNFREGNFKYILTCNLFNEGIDIPETNLLAFLRTTNSRLIWLQQLGRGLRRTKEKEFVDVFDFVGSLDRVQEIEAFRSAYEKQEIDEKNINKEVFLKESKEENFKKLKYHDSSIKVSWKFKGAAKVLELIEKQKYSLLQFNEAINSLRAYYEEHNKIPNIEDIDENLIEVSSEQINTLFNSYYAYCELSLPYNKEDYSQYFKDKFLNYCEVFYKENGIVPSFKTIEANLIEKNLPLIDKNFINNVFRKSNYPAKIFDEEVKFDLEKLFKNKI